MDIYSYIKKDHQAVNKLFNELLAAKNKKKREELFEKVKTELLIHNRSE